MWENRSEIDNLSIDVVSFRGLCRWILGFHSSTPPHASDDEAQAKASPPVIGRFSQNDIGKAERTTCQRPELAVSFESTQANDKSFARSMKDCEETLGKRLVRTKEKAQSMALTDSVVCL